MGSVCPIFDIFYSKGSPTSIKKMNNFSAPKFDENPDDGISLHKFNAKRKMEQENKSK